LLLLIINNVSFFYKDTSGITSTYIYISTLCISHIIEQIYSFCFLSDLILIYVHTKILPVIPNINYFHLTTLSLYTHIYIYIYLYIDLKLYTHIHTYIYI